MTALITAFVALHLNFTDLVAYNRFKWLLNLGLSNYFMFCLDCHWLNGLGTYDVTAVVPGATGPLSLAVFLIGKPARPLPVFPILYVRVVHHLLLENWVLHRASVLSCLEVSQIDPPWGVMGLGSRTYTQKRIGIFDMLMRLFDVLVPDLLSIWNRRSVLFFDL